MRVRYVQEDEGYGGRRIGASDKRAERVNVVSKRGRVDVYAITTVAFTECGSMTATSSLITRAAPESQRSGAENRRAANLGQKSKQDIVSVVFAGSPKASMACL